MDSQFLSDRIEKTKEMIVALEAAILALTSSNIQSFTLDTGQTREVVQKRDISRLEMTLEELYSRLSNLEERLTGCGVFNVVPGW